MLHQYLEESDVVTIPYATTLTENEKHLQLIWYQPLKNQRSEINDNQNKIAKSEAILIKQPHKTIEKVILAETLLEG